MSVRTETTRHCGIVELPGGSVLVQGHLELAEGDGVRPLRLPRHFWDHFPPAGEILRAIVSTASGVRIAVDTEATRLRLSVRCSRMVYGDLLGPVNHFVAEVDGRIHAAAEAPVNALLRLSMSGDEAGLESLSEAAVVELGELPTGAKTVVIWLPQGMVVDLLDISGDAPVRAATPRPLPVWLHHGSSISHCVETPLPTGVWPVAVARATELDLVNLGYGGQCMLDSFVADAIAATPADVISIKVGVNIVGARSLDQRTFTPALQGFLDRIRRGHPRTPIVLASSILWPDSEEVPGPPEVEFLPDGRLRCFTAGDPRDVAKGALTMAESRRQVARVAATRAAGGESTHYLDGLSLYGPADRERFVLPDSLHPDTALYAEMARRFAQAVFAPDGLVPRHTL